MLTDTPFIVRVDLFGRLQLKAARMVVAPHEFGIAPLVQMEVVRQVAISELRL